MKKLYLDHTRKGILKISVVLVFSLTTLFLNGQTTNTRTWKGGHAANTTSWHIKQNWSENNVPDANSIVTIPNTTHKPIITAEAACLDLTINNGGVLTINSNITFSVYRNWTNNGTFTANAGTVTFNGTAAQTIGGTSTSIFHNLTIGASSAGTTISAGAKVTVSNTLTSNNKLTVNSASLTSSGSLIVTGTSTGTVTYNRWLKAGDYQLISAPVNTSASGGSWESGEIEIFDTYHENDDFWYEASKTADLVNGKGYGMIASTAGAVGFTGTLNGPVTYSLDKTNTPQFIYGWNLVGNPYTSAIGINNQSTGTNFLGVNTGAIDDNHEAVYVWDVDAYKCIANSGFTFPMLGGEGTLGQNYLQAGQGFFIRAATDESEISFNINMQAHQPTIELKSAEKSWPGVQLKAKTADAGHYTIVTYHQDMTPGLDVSYDAGLLSAGGEIELFTRLVNDNGVDFMIQAVPDYDFEQNAVPVGVNFAKGGEVTFSGYVVPLDGNYKIYLEDRLTGVLTDLSQDEYTVTLSANTKGTGRFFIVAAQTTGIETPGEISDNLMIWASDRKIHIRGELSGKATARLLDLNGRLIMETSLPDTRNNLVQAPVRTGGIYLLQVLDGNRHTTRKVVIN